MLPDEAEDTLTQLIRTRLKGDALDLIRGDIYNKVDDSIKALKQIYSRQKSAAELCEEITKLLQLSGENVAQYFNRAKHLETKIIEAYKFENNNVIDAARKLEWEQLCAKYFVLGLNKDIFLSI